MAFSSDLRHAAGAGCALVDPSWPNLALCLYARWSVPQGAKATASLLLLLRNLIGQLQLDSGMS
jgi:hypothetical protein